MVMFAMENLCQTAIPAHSRLLTKIGSLGTGCCMQPRSSLASTIRECGLRGT